MFKCSICGNEDPKYIGVRNGKEYCRRCISFFGEPANENEYFRTNYSTYYLKYPLTVEQKRVSDSILENFKNKKDTLVYAVCGAGKTELIFETISYALSLKLKVGFAIPRRDVAIELAERFEKAFSNNTITAVYGGNTNLLIADIVILTTHQLYRYENFFDLLILDEIDAFPYNGNEVLNSFFKRSIKGNYVLMSATPSKEILEEFTNENKEIVSLFTRYHLHEIPVPKIIVQPYFLQINFIVKKLKEYQKNKKKVFIFVPTISDSEVLFKLLNIFVKGGNFVNSKSEKRLDIINDFKNGKYFYLVTTAILERGVTVKDLQIIIFNADSDIYNSSSLIQISGRAGRVIDAPYGEVYYVASKKTYDMEEAIRKVENANKVLQDVLQKNRK